MTLEEPTAYLPMDRLQALAWKRDLPEHAQGAALFADISGFTSLTEMLARVLGPKRGAEELTVHLNHVYDALISELHRFGGSAISFGGDAITCWFDEGEGSCAASVTRERVNSAVLRAVGCALAMQRSMTRFASVAVEGGGTVALAVKTAVAHGSVRRFVVGDPGYSLIDVMAGATVARLAAAEDLAEVGEVILHAATVEALGGCAAIAEWRTHVPSGERCAVVAGLSVEVPDAPWPEIPEGAIDEDQVRPWILPQVYSRLTAAQGGFLAELRPAAALFLRFGGLDYDDDPSAPAILDAFIRQVERVLTRHDGNLLQILIGDKGSYLYAAFGAPKAHEDDVDRAALAALDIQALPVDAAFRDSLQIGIAYGRMRVGAYGSRVRRTYGVLGDDVNLSARLMQAAQPGQILVSDEARARASTGGMFSWETPPPVRLKGKSAPVVVHRLLRGAASSVGVPLDTMHPFPAVGRRSIFDALDASLSRTLAGKGDVVRLEGEAGMGKSHCAAHFSRDARDQGARIALGLCQSMTRSSPYAPWRQILSDLLGLTGASERENLERLAVIAGAHPSWALRLPVLGDILGLPVPENPTTAALDSQMRQKTLFSLVVEILKERAAEQPLVLILDDAHWMDEASLALTLKAAGQAAGGAPVMILLLHRPAHGEEAPILVSLADLPHYTELTLDEMSAGDVSALVQRSLEGPASPLLLAVARKLTRGNPFFIGEMLETMHESGRIARDEMGLWRLSEPVIALLQKGNVLTQTEGQWQLKPEADLSAIQLGIPDSVHGLILSRLDHMPEAQKVTLKVCSVIGQTIDLELLRLAHPDGRSLPELEQEAASMTRSGWLRREGATEEVYAFCHHTSREVAYDTLLFSQRRGLHRAVAFALAERRPDAVPEVAHHAFLGEAWPLALRYTILAGDQAKHLYANQQSLDFFEKALRSAESVPEEDTAGPRKRIHLALGELLVSTGQSEAARPHLEAALGLAKADDDRESEARCCRWYARSYEARAEYAQALEWLNAGIAALDGRLSIEDAELSLVAGLISFRQGLLAEAIASCERGVRLGESLEDPSIRARAYNLTGIVELRRNGAVAIERFRQSLDEYQKLGNVYGQATSHNLIANGWFALCDWSRADAEYRLAQDLFVQIGDLYNQVLVGSNLGGVALRQERFDAALAHYQKAIRLLEQMGGSLFVSGGIHLNMGNVYIRKGDYDTALAELETARADLEQAKVREFLPELYGLFAEAAWRRGDLDAAERYARQSVDLARELSMTREEGHNLRIVGEIARSRGRGDLAEESFKTSIQLLDEAGDEEEGARSRLALARMQADRAGSDPGRPLLPILAHCEAVFERMGAESDLHETRELRRRIEGSQPA